MADEIPEIADELVIELDTPIVVEGVTYSTLTLHEPTADQVMKAQAHLVPGASYGHERLYLIALIAACAGVPREVVQQLPVRKQNQAGQYCQSFIESATPAIDPQDLPDELTVEIDPPVKVNGGSFTEITLHEPTADMVQKADSLLTPGAGVEVVTARNILLVSLAGKVPKGRGRQDADPQAQLCSQVSLGFRRVRLVPNYRELIPVLTKFWNWTPETAGALTGTQLTYWLDAANEMATAKR